MKNRALVTMAALATALTLVVPQAAQAGGGWATTGKILTGVAVSRILFPGNRGYCAPAPRPVTVYQTAPVYVAPAYVAPAYAPPCRTVYTTTTYVPPPPAPVVVYRPAPVVVYRSYRTVQVVRPCRSTTYVW